MVASKVERTRPSRVALCPRWTREFTGIGGRGRCRHGLRWRRRRRWTGRFPVDREANGASLTRPAASNRSGLSEVAKVQRLLVLRIPTWRRRRRWRRCRRDRGVLDHDRNADFPAQRTRQRCGDQTSQATLQDLLGELIRRSQEGGVLDERYRASELQKSTMLRQHRVPDKPCRHPDHTMANVFSSCTTVLLPAVGRPDAATGQVSPVRRPACSRRSSADAVHTVVHKLCRSSRNARGAPRRAMGEGRRADPSDGPAAPST